MIRRCYNEEHVKYASYGGRGIRVCKRWLESFDSFLEDMGVPAADKTLDRRDNNKNYTPSNCRWASRKQQARNTRANRLITIDGETRCLTEWCEIRGIPISTVYARLHAGWSETDALTPGRFGGTARKNLLRHHGRMCSRAELAREHGMDPTLVHHRIHQQDMTLAEALQKPPQQPLQYTYKGETHPLAEWGRRLGIHPNTLRFRITKLGWSIQKAFTQPPRKRC